MRYFERLACERDMRRIPQLEAVAADLRKQANKLAPRFWHSKRDLRERANEAASHARSLERKWRGIALPVKDIATENNAI